MGRRGTAGSRTDRHDGGRAPRPLAARRRFDRARGIRQYPRQVLARGLMPSFNSVAVIGAGAWGTALAGVVARAGREVTLYARNGEAAANIRTSRKNPRLPGVELDPHIAVSSDPAEAAAADIVMLAVPAQNLREAARALAPHLASATPVIACAKGIERGTHRFMTEVIAEI